VPFQCPQCARLGSLFISARLEIPADAKWDEISLQIVRCRSCGFLGLAVYEESRRGALDSEIVHHIGYDADDEDLKSILRMIRKCPRPTDTKCNCSTHQTLGHKDEHGCWDGLGGIRLGSHFEMKLAG